MKKKDKIAVVSDFENCQIQCIPKFASDAANYPSPSVYIHIKRKMAFLWNHYYKKWLKNIYYFSFRFKGAQTQQSASKVFIHQTPLNTGDLVMVRPMEEIASTLDPFRELKGCSFLPGMVQYCGTRQRVFKSMRYFLDERDYKLKKTRGLVLLENVLCEGTPVFGPCDRSCFLFWREEWLEKIQ